MTKDLETAWPFTAGNRDLSNRRIAPSTELRRCRSAFLQPESLPGGHKTRPMDSLPEPTRSDFANSLHGGRLLIFAKEVFPHLAAVFVAGDIWHTVQRRRRRLDRAISRRSQIQKRRLYLQRQR